MRPAQSRVLVASSVAGRERIAATLADGSALPARKYPLDASPMPWITVSEGGTPWHGGIALGARMALDLTVGDDFEGEPMTFVPQRMSFGVFMAPFHRVGENPTLAMERDLDLIEYLDNLGFDE